MRHLRAALENASAHNARVRGDCGKVCAVLVGGGWAFGKEPVRMCPLFRRVGRKLDREVWVECAESVEEAVALALQDEEKPCSSA